MIGTIIGIEDDGVLAQLNMDVIKQNNIVGYYVLISGNNSIVGEVTAVKNNMAFISLMGEVVDKKFVFGVIHKPMISSNINLISSDSISSIIGIDDYDESKHLYIGESALYNGVKVGFEFNKFFNNHFAIFGTTGSGKSCGVARIVQNMFSNRTKYPLNASLFIFDAYNEYHQAFSKFHENNPAINFKSYTTNFDDLRYDVKNNGNRELLTIPLWLLTVDDFALLLGAERISQIPIIEKALKLVNVFVKKDATIITHKNDIIARALLDILSSGKPSSQIRDQIFSVLAKFNTQDLNLESPVFQPGYTRKLKQCFIIDDTGKIREMELLTTFFQKFLVDNLEYELPDGTFMFTLKDLELAFEFALISEGVLSSERAFDDFNILKVHLHTLVNGEYGKYFEYKEYVSADEYIKKLLTTKEGEKAQIVNFNINYVDDRFAKVITKIYSKLLFDYAKDYKPKGTFPFNIILEEAHRYVQNDNDVTLLGYNIFERITKEGRKYGVMLGLISQRPSELSEVAISQCTNFLIFKMLHPRDIKYIKEMVPNATTDIVKKLKVLQPGHCVAFGSAFKTPVVVKFDMPNPEPASDSCNISKAWFTE